MEFFGIFQKTPLGNIVSKLEAKFGCPKTTAKCLYPYLKSLRQSKARPKPKKLIMFCLKLREIKVSPLIELSFTDNDHFKGGRTHQSYFTSCILLNTNSINSNIKGFFSEKQYSAKKSVI